MSVIFSAEVERITFESEESGFRVIRVGQIRGMEAKKSIVVVGIMPPLGVGMEVRIAGKKTTSAKHGEQVKAESVVPLIPEESDSLERYLGSGVVQGLGPGFAKRVVRYFGDKTLRVLDNDPQRLLEVPGLGKKRADEIKEGWNQHRSVSNLLLALSGHGISPALSARIVEVFKDRAAEIVQNRPYELSLKVKGIGFKIADGIAAKNGVKGDNAARVAAGVLHELRQLADSGHTRAPRSLLIERAAQMLEVSDRSCEQAFDELALRDFIVADAAFVALKSLDDAERSVAERLQQLKTSNSRSVAGLSAKIAAFEKRSGLVLAAAQKQAVQSAILDKLAVITGGPGVGKTTIIRCIVELLQAERVRISLAAPTGRAAKRLSEGAAHKAQTIHRLLGVTGRNGQFSKNAESPIEADVIIIDESSMIDISLAASLLEAIADAARVIFVGDADQLASVGPGAFLFDMIASESVPVSRLDVIFRQGKESGIVQNAHRVLAGELPEGSPDAEGDFFVIKAKDQEHAAHLIEEIVSKRAPARFGVDSMADIQVLTPLHRGESGTQRLNQRLQAALNPEGQQVSVGEIVFRVGDKVLQTKNDYERDVFNGDSGRVVSVDAEAGSVEVLFEASEAQRRVSYTRSDLIQLMPAYAMTIHKSQGSEYPVVVIPVLNAHFVMLSRNLLYTALTRAQRVCILVVQARALALAVAEVRKEERMTGLRERLH